MNYSKQLRDELIQRAKTLVATRGLSAEKFYLSRSATPVSLFKRHKANGIEHHHNFSPASFESILQRKDWIGRLQKRHGQGKAFYPSDQTSAKELDSCCSSDALLMNIFCHPEVGTQAGFFRMFGFRSRPQVDFGFKPYLPFVGGGAEPRSSEIDLRLSTPDRLVLCEAKLTELDFTSKAIAKVERYADFPVVVDVVKLPRKKDAFLHYQLIRNALAAHHLGAAFFLLCDERRPDLCAAFDEIRESVKINPVKQRPVRLTCRSSRENCRTIFKNFLRRSTEFSEQKRQDSNLFI